MSDMYHDEASETKRIESEINDVCNWLHSIALIPLNTKLTDEGSVFGIYEDTLLNWWHRTFRTKDSGINHARTMAARYPEIKSKIIEWIKNYPNLPVASYHVLKNKLEQSKQGLKNFLSHSKYNKIHYITSQLTVLLELAIPSIITIIDEHLRQREHHQKSTTTTNIVASSSSSSPSTAIYIRPQQAEAHVRRDFHDVFRQVDSPQTMLFHNDDDTDDASETYGSGLGIIGSLAT